MSSVTKNSIRVFGCVAALAFSQLAPAASFVVHGSLDAGGETLATAVYTDGENTDVKAGQLIHLAVGLVQPLSDDFEVQGTVGWKFDNAGAIPRLIDTPWRDCFSFAPTRFGWAVEQRSI